MRQATIYWKMPRFYIMASMLVVAMYSSVLADGKFFFPSMGAEKDPGIPFQRAIIAYHDGVETLVIESAVDAPGGDLGWVIPLPAEPTSIAKCKAGTLKATYQLVCPWIEANTEGILKTVGSLVLLYSLLACLITAHYRKKGQKPLPVLIKVLMIVFIVFFNAFILLPSLSRARTLGVDASGVDVLQHKQVGSYDVKVITGDSANSILVWASENGFRVPQEAKPVLEEYIKTKWCFAAAKIQSADKGLIAPHPLKFTFKTPKAVYPMKLTGVGAIDMQFDLYVIGQERALVPQLDLISCGKYQSGATRQWIIFDDDVKAKYNIEIGVQYEANDIRLTIGHPDITSLMWSGCTLTHLRKKLRPEQMQVDYEIDWAAAHPVRKKLYTPSALRGHSMALACLFASAILLPAAIVVSMRRKNERQSNAWLPKVIGVGLLVGILAGAISYVWLPSTTAVPEDRSEAIRAWRMRYRMPWIYSDILTELCRSDNTIDSESFPEWWRQQFPSNEDLDQLPQEGDLPGGYEFSKEGDALILTIYDEYATPIRFTVASDDAGIQSSTGDGKSDS